MPTNGWRDADDRALANYLNGSNLMRMIPYASESRKRLGGRKNPARANLIPPYLTLRTSAKSKWTTRTA